MINRGSDVSIHWEGQDNWLHRKRKGREMKEMEDRGEIHEYLVSLVFSESSNS